MTALDRIVIALENLVTLRVLLDGGSACMMHHTYPCGHIWAELGALNPPSECLHCTPAPKETP